MSKIVPDWCPELDRPCIGKKCSQIEEGICKINPWVKVDRK